MTGRWGYPAARARGPDRAPGQPERYERYESTSAEITSTDDFVDAITFSGRVDAVRLSARTAGVRFRLSDRLDRQTHFVIVEAGITDEVRIPCERVAIRSLVDAAAGSAFITGMYAQPAEYSSGAEARGQDAP